MNAEAKAILEAALLCAQQPLGTKDMLTLLGAEASREGLAVLLAELQAEWQARGSLRLIETASGWRFQTHGAVRAALESLHPEKPRRYSRAAMETLAVIAYRQPVTRGDIEDIRGVVVSSDIVKQLEERGWIEVIGQRDAPGRPQLYATTKQFLDDLGLSSLVDLPPLDDMGAAPELAMPELPQQASLLDLAEAPAETAAEAEGAPDAQTETPMDSEAGPEVQPTPDSPPDEASPP
jgi:segregation and condensation protein B